MSALARQVELVDGRLGSPEIELPGILADPDTGVALQPQRASSNGVVEAAIAAAWRAHADGAWRRASVDERAAPLAALADALEQRAEEIALADCIETGIPIAVARGMGASGGPIVREAIRHLREAGTVQERSHDGRPIALHRVPWGPVAAITPWNAPFPTAVKKVAFALAAGCPVVLKPSEHAPTSAGLLAEAVVAADLAPGLVGIVHGDAAVGARLVSDPRIKAVALTGGIRGGQAVARACADQLKPLQLELGGTNPAIVLDDADLALTARALVGGMTKLNGQWCEAPRRALVPRQHADELLERLCDELSTVTIGSRLRDDVAMGPLAHRAQRDRVAERLAALVAAGATVHAPSALPDLAGWFLAPAVVTGAAPEATVEEIFGPVLTLHPYDDEPQALAAANAAGDGLDGYVFSADPRRAMRVGAELVAGEVKVNGTSAFDLCPGSAQGFFGASGLGGHGDRELLEFFRGARIVGVDDAGAPF